MTDPILHAEQISVHFGGVRALDEVSISAYPGEIHGLIGPNGSGKTTLIDAISGFERLTSGTIQFSGQEISGWSPQRRSRGGLVRSFQSLELFNDLTVDLNLRVGIPYSVAGERSDLLSEIAEQCGLQDVMHTEVRELSHGEQGIVSLARALAAAPSLLVLDEPAAGVDAKTVETMKNVLREWAGRCAILLVEHDISLVGELCDRVTLLALGRALIEGGTEEVLASSEIREVYLGGLE